MEFSVDHWLLYVIVGGILLLVLGQSFFFLLRAWKAGKEIGISVKTMRKTVISAAIFTIAPAISILMGMITLTNMLGVPLPWLRLSVIGALTYEVPAAEAAAKASGVAEGATGAVTGDQFINIAIVMTLGIVVSLILVPIFCKKIQSGVEFLKNRDSKWGDIIITSLFMGMISAFTGLIFNDVQSGLVGWIPVFVMLVSALVMALIALLMKLTNWKWLTDYALPISMLSAMAASIPITNWIV